MPFMFKSRIFYTVDKYFRQEIICCDGKKEKYKNIIIKLFDEPENNKKILPQLHQF